jgi:hypothetical protein
MTVRWLWVWQKASNIRLAMRLLELHHSSGVNEFILLPIQHKPNAACVRIEKCVLVLFTTVHCGGQMRVDSR